MARQWPPAHRPRPGGTSHESANRSPLRPASA